MIFMSSVIAFFLYELWRFTALNGDLWGYLKTLNDTVGRGLAPAQSYKTGMVAMFYFSEDGSDVQLEYISSYRTLESQKTDPEKDDVLSSVSFL